MLESVLIQESLATRTASHSKMKSSNVTKFKATNTLAKHIFELAPTSLSPVLSSEDTQITLTAARGWGETPHMKEVGMLVVSLRGGCEFRILVSLRVFWAKGHHI